MLQIVFNSRLIARWGGFVLAATGLVLCGLEIAKVLYWCWFGAIEVFSITANQRQIDGKPTADKALTVFTRTRVLALEKPSTALQLRANWP